MDGFVSVLFSAADKCLKAFHVFGLALNTSMADILSDFLPSWAVDMFRPIFNNLLFELLTGRDFLDATLLDFVFGSLLAFVIVKIVAWVIDTLPVIGG